ncbi:hypothetical protein FHT02_004180 [Sphingomonas xinjiangensis]|uniref:Uncharacterized protein n=1 Tax=Sphingomonas xinjiangensis TaxID=643568 RepID=A0A840YTC1_9SPHN|nr:hypothetical protein [Sphingomonas xinjiangensis]
MALVLEATGATAGASAEIVAVSDAGRTILPGALLDSGPHAETAKENAHTAKAAADFWLFAIIDHALSMGPNRLINEIIVTLITMKLRVRWPLK